MGEMVCRLEWQREEPRIVIEGFGELTEAQIRDLCHVLGETAVRKVNCMLSCDETGCKKEEGHYGHRFSGSGATSSRPGDAEVKH